MENEREKHPRSGRNSLSLSALLIIGSEQEVASQSLVQVVVLEGEKETMFAGSYLLKS